jgi:hypothetical protein
MAPTPPLPSIDGAVIDSAELSVLVSRVAAELPALFSDLDPARRKQVDALICVLDDVALRLIVPAPSDLDRTDLSCALADGDDARALSIARRIAVAERARMSAPNWSLFA